jgi:hypothetical protein
MTIYKSRCYNGGKQHKFSPRYSEEPNPNPIHTNLALFPNQMRELIYYKEYLFDICEWCGKKVTK